MALDRGERGYRGDHFSRGGGPQDRREHEEESDREHFGSAEYDEEYADYPSPRERRHWRGNDYRVSQESPDRGRSYQRQDDDRERFIDTRQRGFLRGESAARYGRQNEWTPGERPPREPFGEQDRWSGPYVGRGPKGYRRSDERIHEDICERLTEHPSIDASDIEVSVHDGDVTLFRSGGEPGNQAFDRGYDRDRFRGEGSPQSPSRLDAGQRHRFALVIGGDALALARSGQCA